MPRRRPRKGRALSGLCAARGSVQLCPSVSAAVWIRVPALRRHGRKARMHPQYIPNKAMCSSMEKSGLLPYSHSLLSLLFFQFHLCSFLFVLFSCLFASDSTRPSTLKALIEKCLSLYVLSPQFFHNPIMCSVQYVLFKLYFDQHNNNNNLFLVSY